MDSITKEPSWKVEGSENLLRDCVPNKPQDTAATIVSKSVYLGNSELLSKDSIDTVESINNKPSVEAEGVNQLRDATPESTIECDSHIVTHGRFSRKQEILMSEHGFIKLPRSLLKDPVWRGLRSKYKQVFITILERAAWKKTPFQIQGNRIELQPGQLCVSYRNLVDMCNEDIAFKEDHVDKNIVERAVSVFFKIQIVRQEVRHGRMILTVTIPGIYEDEKNQTETQPETRPRQDRDTNEESERKRRREEIAKRSDSDMGVVGGSEPIAIAKRSPLSNLDQKKKRSFTSEELQILKDCCEQWPGISEKAMRIWLSKFDLAYVTMQLDVMAAKKPESIANYEKWMEGALKKDYAGAKKNIPINRDFAERFKNEKRWSMLEVLQQYCRINYPGGESVDYQFKFDPEQFRQMLTEKFESLNGAY